MKHLSKIHKIFKVAILSVCVFILSTCSEKIDIESITLNYTDIEFAVGEKVELVATVSPKDANQPIVIDNTDSDVAKFLSGFLWGLNDGTTTITFRTPDGSISASCFITVYKPRLPTLTTSTATNITTTTATLGGKITDEGKPVYTEKGIVYATTENPTLDKFKYVYIGSMLDDFSLNVTNLTINTTYYVRAYAINSEGIAYGAQESFSTSAFNSLPSLTTNTVNIFTSTTAILGGTIINAGDPEYTERGVCFSTTPNPNLENNKTVITGTGTGDFNRNITGLRANTTYYVRAYAINTEGVVYGEEIEFTTSTSGTLATITTAVVNNFTETTAILGGNITYSGNTAYSERGIVYALTTEPTTDDYKVVVAGSGTGSFNTEVSDLTAGTTYYVRAYAINSAGTAYGAQVSFTTFAQGVLPALITNETTNIAITTAQLNAIITAEGTPAYTEKGFVYATTQNPTTANSKVSVMGTGIGNFSSDISGLTTNRTYYVRAFATNSIMTVYGNQISFTTDGTLPTLTTNSVTTFTATTATFGGNISNLGSPAYTERGVVYSTTPSPTTDNFKIIISGTGFGSFNTNVGGLSPNTTYYIRAYAISSVGTAYGQQVSFNTSGIPILSTNPVTIFTATSATLGGNIINSGTPSYTERGVCFSTSPNPTVDNNKTVITGSGTGNFSRSVTGLTENTTYYVRAYATNAGGTSYGNEESFIAISPVITINTHPETNTNVTAGSITGSLNVNASITLGATLSYQWYSNTTNSNSGGTAISGATSASFPLPTMLMVGTHYYFCEVRATGGATSVRSNVAIVNVSMLTIDMVHVQGGTFTMGCTGEQFGDCDNDESPTHQVTLSGFSIGKYAVTQVQWVAIMGSNPSYNKGDNLPVEWVSWNDIVGTSGASVVINGITYRENGFIYKLNQITGKNYRLPTESEWEFAARGGNNSLEYKYSGSSIIGNVAWYSSNSSNSTQIVGTKAPNELGIYDMSGNVEEWCSNWYGAYTATIKSDPTGPASGSNRVIRGGSFFRDARICRVAYRDYYTPGTRSRTVGFRLALSE